MQKKHAKNFTPKFRSYTSTITNHYSLFELLEMLKLLTDDFSDSIYKSFRPKLENWNCLVKFKLDETLIVTNKILRKGHFGKSCWQNLILNPKGNQSYFSQNTFGAKLENMSFCCFFCKLTFPFPLHWEFNKHVL